MRPGAGAAARRLAVLIETGPKALRDLPAAELR